MELRTFKTPFPVLVFMLCTLFTVSLLAQKPAVTVGTVIDGPWERNQMVRGAIQVAVEQALRDSHEVLFPDSKRLEGDWTRNGVRAAIDRLMADPDVDYIVTPGLLASYEAASRGFLAKPTIAARVVAPDLLHIPSRVVEGRRVSGVENLSYVTVVGIDLKQSTILFRNLTGFDRVTFVIMDPIRQIYPDIENAVRIILKDLELEQIDFIFVKEDLSRPLRQIKENTQAVILTPLPQLERGAFEEFLDQLRQLRLPTFTLGTRQDIEAGVMLGINAPDEIDQVAKRVAENLKQMVTGVDAASLPVELGVKESLAINNAAAAAIGFSIEQAVAANAQETATAPSPANASMLPLGDERIQLGAASRAPQLTAEELQARQATIAEKVQKEILRLSSYTAFDSVNFRVEGAGRVVLLGFAFTPSLKSGAQQVVEKIEEVEEVVNLIEVLPNSAADDDVRTQTYVSIYGHPTMRRYVPGAGYSSGDIRNFIRDVRINLRAAQMTRGPHPIHILVKNGNVALVGYVFSELDRQIAEVQANSVRGAFSVENHLEVIRR